MMLAVDAEWAAFKAALIRSRGRREAAAFLENAAEVLWREEEIERRRCQGRRADERAA